jgi:hypothetical protein
MPCRDYYDDHPEAYFRDVTEPALKAQISFAESALCATLDALESVVTSGKGDFGPPDFYDEINFKEAGITKKELIEWRKKHKVLDEKHRAEELLRLRESGIAKLTPAERKALGFE